MQRRQARVFEQLWMTAWQHGVPQMSKHAAALVIDKEIVAIGWNKNKTHPLQHRYAKNDHAIELHAEIDTIVNSLRTVHVDDLRRADLYIARVKYEKQSYKQFEVWGNSEPCDGCRRAIESFGIRKVFYTLDSPKDKLEIEHWDR